MQMKLTQKVDHFTVFEGLPSTSCCSQKFSSNNLEKIGWLDVWGSIRDVFIGWMHGRRWTGKKRLYTVQNCGRALVKHKNQREGVVLAPWWLKWSTWKFGLLKQALTLDIASPDTSQCLKPPFEPSIHTSVNSSLLQSALGKYTKGN